VFERETFERAAEFGGETFLRGLGDFPRSALLLFDFVRLLCQSLSANELALLIEPPFFFVDAEG
jgi:hypothetical protein